MCRGRESMRNKVAPRVSGLAETLALSKHGTGLRGTATAARTARAESIADSCRETYQPEGAPALRAAAEELLAEEAAEKVAAEKKAAQAKGGKAKAKGKKGKR